MDQLQDAHLITIRPYFEQPKHLKHTFGIVVDGEENLFTAVTYLTGFKEPACYPECCYFACSFGDESLRGSKK